MVEKSNMHYGMHVKSGKSEDSDSEDHSGARTVKIGQRVCDLDCSRFLDLTVLAYVHR